MINPKPRIDEASSVYHVLHNRNFLLLWMAQAISMTAQNATWFALAIIVEEATHSSVQLSFVILTSITPSVLLSLVAGALVDRMNKRNVLVATNLLRAIVVLGYLLYGQALGFIYLVNVLFVSIGQFFGPAEYATIPAVVPKKQLVAANALYNFTFNGSQLLGIVVVAPVFLKLFGAPSLFIGEAVIYVIAGILVALLPAGEAPRKPLSSLKGGRVARQVWQEIQEGWSYTRGDPYISLAMVHLTLVATLVLLVAMLGPRFTVAVLGIRADDAVYVLAPAVIGILVGTLTMSRLVNRLGKETVISIGLVVLGAGLLLLSLLHWLGQVIPASVPTALGIMMLPRAVGLVPTVMALTAVLGLSVAMVMIPAQTVIMERTLPENRGRIFSVQLLLGNLAAILPLVFLGELADLVTVEVVMAIVAAMVLAAAAFTIRYLHRIEREHGPSHGSSDPESEE
ncbi:MAG: MFS transporter [Bacteroidetes bacterium]|nr:MFS transporter [Bacteroidota bacterium]MCL5026909.1 MFS transporter [Chloroflexota bacterium]